MTYREAVKMVCVVVGLAFCVAAALALGGCAGHVPPVTPPPTPPPVVIVHTPVCAPPTLVNGCWHQPPGQDWQFIPPAPPKPTTWCPKELAPGAHVYVQAKPYGNGFDSTVRIVGDPELCRLVHGAAVGDCHLEGWGQRSACELELLGKTIAKPQACAEWEYRAAPADPWQPCRMTGSGAVTCDHHGETAAGRDDPQTPAFEGTPAVCGEQRDAEGHPKAGTFIVAHGRGEIRSCTPDHAPTGCGDPKPVDY